MDFFFQKSTKLDLWLNVLLPSSQNIRFKISKGRISKGGIQCTYGSKKVLINSVPSNESPSMIPIKAKSIPPKNSQKMIVRFSNGHSHRKVEKKNIFNIFLRFQNFC